MQLGPFVRTFTLSVLFLTAGIHAVAQVRSPENRPRNCSISGRVTVGGNPLQHRIVIATEIQEGNQLSVGDVSLNFDGASSAPAYSARTDADGRYRIISLPAGKYEVSLHTGAYVPVRKPGEGEPEVTLDDGEAKENVNFALVRGGVITGRVTDAEGRPLIERQVEIKPLMPEPKPGEENRPTPPEEAFYGGNTAETDDRGVYRAYGIRAGRYVVSSAGGRTFLNELTPSKYAKTFHPNVTEEAQARVIEVTEGGETANVDIQLGAARKGFEVAGRIIDAETGQPLPQVSLFCLGVGVKDGQMPGFNGATKSDDKGAFRFSGLQSGQYSIQMTPMLAGLTGAPSEHYAEELKFEVIGSDVGGLELRAKRAAAISGTAVLETAPDLKANTNLGQLMLTAAVMPAGEPSGEPNSERSLGFPASGMGMTKLNSDGSFRLTGLSPGKAMLHLFAIGGTAPVIKRIERNNVELRDGIEVKAGETVAGVKIVLVYARGVIRGQVNITGGRLPEGWRMTALAARPDATPTEQGGFAQVDGKGRFVMEGLLDGEYEVVVHVTSLNPDAGSLPSVSQTVRVVNGAETQVTLTLDLSKK